MGPEEFATWVAGETETMHQFMKTFGMAK
jgi:hypothetical protein